MGALCSLFGALAVAHVSYTPVPPPKVLDQFQNCTGVTYPIAGITGGWGSVVTCPNEIKSAADQERDRSTGCVTDPVRCLRTAQNGQCWAGSHRVCDTCYHWDPVVRQSIPSQCNCRDVCNG